MVKSAVVVLRASSSFYGGPAACEPDIKGFSAEFRDVWLTGAMPSGSNAF